MNRPRHTRNNLNTSPEQALLAVALMGPTGTGKSSLAMHIAEACNSAIVCCDSMQIYQKLNIGTAKASIEEQSRVPHFMLDCCELPDSFSAARWAERAATAIRKENQAGRVPLIVGGTGLYLKALTEGFSEIPPEQAGVREKLEHIRKAQGTSGLYRILQEKDGDMAKRLEPGDTQRIMRALCVFESTGKPLSAWQAQDGTNKLEIHCPVFVPAMPRDALRQRIARRFRDMLDTGWLEEVQWLDSLHLDDTHPAMRAVGYRQLLAHVRGECPLPEAIDAGITATRRYAKRQRTWFTHQTPNAVWGNADQLAPHLIEALQA